MTELTTPRGRRGFTLVEVLVVVVMIGVIVGGALLSVNLAQQGPQVRKEADRLVDVARRAADFALFRGVPTALQLTRSGYRVVLRGRGGWQPFEGDERLMAAHDFGAGVSASVADGYGGWDDLPELTLPFATDGTASAAEIRLVDAALGDRALIRITAAATISATIEPGRGS